MRKIAEKLTIRADTQVVVVGIDLRVNVMVFKKRVVACGVPSVVVPHRVLPLSQDATAHAEEESANHPSSLHLIRVRVSESDFEKSQ